MPTDNKSENVIFKTADEKISVDVRFEGETVCLTLAQLVAGTIGKPLDRTSKSAKSGILRLLKNCCEEEGCKAFSLIIFYNFSYFIICSG